MAIELTSTNAHQIAGALLTERRKAGSPAMGMVMTFVVVTDEGDSYDALKVARAVSREHPARILGIIKRSSRGRPNLDAELSVGGSGESVLLRINGELTKHAESVVLPLLLPDSPVVVWWPRKAPDDPAADPLGKLAQRRITDSAAIQRSQSQAILTQARSYADGNTDLAWTRLTPWRALLAAALDQYPARVSSAVVEAERTNPSADLLVAWLSDRLRVEVTRTMSKGPGITSVTLHTGGGPIEICRPDGLLAEFTIPNAPNRPVALKRRTTPELLAEELRRLDPDDIYAATVKRLRRLADGGSKGTSASGSAALPRSGKTAAPSRRSPASATVAAEASTSAASLSNRPMPDGARSESDHSEPPGQKRTAARKTSPARKSTAAKKPTAKKSSPAKKTSTAKKSSPAKKTSTAKRAGAARKSTTAKRSGTASTASAKRAASTSSSTTASRSSRSRR